MLTVIVPCSNRVSLRETLISTKLAEQVLCVADGPCNVSREIAKQFLNVKYYEIEETGDFGASQRNFGMRLAKTPFISFLDDDDVYVKDGIDKILTLSKMNALNLFKVRFKLRTIWDTYQVAYGNLTTGGIVVPNIPEKLGVWTGRYGCDFDFAHMTYKLLQEKVNYVDFILTLARPHEQKRSV